MIEFTCSRCGKQLMVQDEAAGKRGKCPKCGAILHVPDAHSRPALEPETAQPTTKTDERARASSADAPDHQSDASERECVGSHVPDGARDKQLDQPAKIAMWAGGLGLLVLALSPLFKWINVGGGGVTGISGDGKIVLGVTVVAIIVYAGAVFTRKRLIAVSLGVGAWGTVALFWMGGLIWKVGSVLDSPGVEDNPFATILATQISPGAGLYLGLIGGLIAAAALGYLGFQHLSQHGRMWPFYTVQAGAVLLGLMVAIVMGPERSSQTSSETAGQDSLFSSVATDEPRSEPTTLIEGPDMEAGKQPKDHQPPEAELTARRAYAEEVVLRDVHVGESALGEQGVFGEVKNAGNRTLSEVEITVYCLDAAGQPVSEETFHPVSEAASGWSMRGYMPLRPNYAQQFGYRVKSTSDWSGRVRVKVTDLAFADQDDATIPAQNDPQKRAYLPNIKLRDVRKGEGTLGEAGVFGEVKNAGQRTLTEIEIVIYCLDDSGQRVFEKHYHPVLVSDSSLSIDPDKPLKPNYTEKFGCRMDDAPSDWSGEVEAVVYDLAFAE